jgi:hypothetical protein
VKGIFITVLFLGLSTRLDAQINLVPNPSFEVVTHCIDSGNSVNNAVNWSNPSIGTPDLLSINYCPTTLTSVYYSLPDNQRFGFQYPRSGYNCAGIAVLDTIYDGTREYLQVHLSEALKPGIPYCVEFYTSLANLSSRYAISDVGAFFSVDSVFVDSSNNALYPIIQFDNAITADTYVTDTLSWVKVSGSYIATGGEKYMLIGNFAPKFGTNYIPNYYFSPARPFIYYYIDDVSVIECDSLIGIEENGIENKFKIYPNPANEQLTIEYTLDKPNDSKVTLYDVLGNIVYQYYMDKAYGSYSYSISTNNLAAGMYVARIEINGNLISKKIIKQ